MQYTILSLMAFAILPTEGALYNPPNDWTSKTTIMSTDATPVDTMSVNQGGVKHFPHTMRGAKASSTETISPNYMTMMTMGPHGTVMNAPSSATTTNMDGGDTIRNSIPTTIHMSSGMATTKRALAVAAPSAMKTSSGDTPSTIGGMKMLGVSPSTKKPSRAPTGTNMNGGTRTNKPTSAPTGRNVNTMTNKPTSAPTGMKVNAMTNRPTTVPTGLNMNAMTNNPTSASGGMNNNGNAMTARPTSSPTGKNTGLMTNIPTSAPTGMSINDGTKTKTPTRAPIGTNLNGGMMTNMPTKAPTGNNMNGGATTRTPTSAPTGMNTNGGAMTRTPTSAPTGMNTNGGAMTRTPTRAPNGMNTNGGAMTRTPTSAPTGNNMNGGTMTRTPTSAPTGMNTIGGTMTRTPTSAPTGMNTNGGAMTRTPTSAPTGMNTNGGTMTRTPTSAPTGMNTNGGTMTRTPTSAPTFMNMMTNMPTNAPTVMNMNGGTMTTKPTSAPTIMNTSGNMNTNKPTLAPSDVTGLPSPSPIAPSFPSLPVDSTSSPTSEAPNSQSIIPTIAPNSSPIHNGETKAPSVDGSNHPTIPSGLPIGSSTPSFAPSVRPPFSCLGNCTVSMSEDNCYQLTDDAKRQSGVMWYEEPLRVDASFAVEVDLYFGVNDGPARNGVGSREDPGGDGIAFVLQSSGPDVVVGPGGIGYATISPSLAVEFDTYFNRNTTDVMEDHVALVRDGEAVTGVIGQVVGLSYNLEDGTFHRVKIEWMSGSSTINVSINGTIVLSSSSVNMTDIFAFDFAYVGFTASTGASTNVHKVCVRSIDGTSYEVPSLSPSELSSSVPTSLMVPTAPVAPSTSLAPIVSPSPSVAPSVRPPFSCLGNCTVSMSEDNCYQLTDDAKRQSGVMWYEEPLRVDASFVVEVDLYFGVNDGPARNGVGSREDPGGDGIAFVLQSSGPDVVVGPGGIGYATSSPSLAVEFDTYFNRNTTDVMEDHVALVRDGEAVTGMIGQVVGLSYNLEDGTFHRVKIEWMSGSSTINVSINGTIVLSSSSVNMTDIFAFDFAYVGFTASTGASTNVHKVCVRSIDGTSYEVPSLSPSELSSSVPTSLMVPTAPVAPSTSLAPIVSPSPSVAPSVRPPFSCLGNCTVSMSEDNCYQLTDDAKRQSGVMWYEEPLRVDASFAVEVDLYFGVNDGPARNGVGSREDPGGDGIAFVLQSSGPDVVVGPGGIGYATSSPSLAVEFDTYFNRNTTDVMEDHVALVRDGEAVTGVIGQVVGLSYNLEDGTFHRVKIEWMSGSSTINVSINGTIVLSSSSVNMTDIFAFDFAYVGFTASTGASTNVHKVCVRSIDGTSYEVPSLSPSELSSSVPTSLMVPTAPVAPSTSLAPIVSPSPSVAPSVRPPFSCLGNCTVSMSEDNCYQLTDDAKRQSGVMWYEEPLRVDASFAAEVDLYFGVNDGPARNGVGSREDPGGDGIAFVLQSSGPDVVVGPGGIGYATISPSLAVEFDTYFNRNTTDVMEDHVALVRDGEAVTGVIGQVVGLSYNLEDGTFHRVKIEWMSGSSTINVSINGTIVLSSSSVNMTDIFAFDFAYMGFTASTGASTNVHKVCVRSIDGTSYEVPSLSPSELSSSVPTSLMVPTAPVAPSTSLAPIVSPSPSVAPSVQSKLPSSILDNLPSFAPSVSPSDMTAVPSSNPSGAVSDAPSMMDSPSPSMMPSLRLSSTPVIGPTASPSRMAPVSPSVESSMAPSLLLSGTPTGSDSDFPSSTMNTVPSALPSPSPSDVIAVTSNIPSGNVPRSGSPSDMTAVPSSNPSGAVSDAPSMMDSPSPSMMPSLRLSSTPVIGPTASPSMMAPVSPSVEFSMTPSLLLSGTPTGSDSDFPSSTMNAFPSFLPSPSPSDVIAFPSSIPSGNVPRSGSPSDMTAVPSSNPSGAVSDAPSMMDSPSPSMMPSLRLSSTPVIGPTASPSMMAPVSPSVESSMAPSLLFSGTPTGSDSDFPSSTMNAFPSFLPSPSPSDVIAFPSSNPSRAVSGAPSIVDSPFPSMMPSLRLSSSPSVATSVSPSNEASFSPSVETSMAPSMILSGTPTGSDSEFPSSMLNDFPTVAPSPSPIDMTSVPSNTPSSTVSETPSNLDDGTAMPSMKPSLRLSALPSAVPSVLIPSARPSFANVVSVAPSIADWMKTGLDIDGEAAGDCSGFSIALSASGTVLAIGAYGNDEGGVDAGQARVYERIDNSSGTVWVQRGNDIDGHTAGELSGQAISLSLDGNILAVGAPTNGTDIGKVRVYEWNKNNSTTWTPLGSAVQGLSTGDLFGSAISLSGDGLVLAVGAYQHAMKRGRVDIFDWNATDNLWMSRKVLTGDEQGDFFGFSVSLNTDGSILAVGACNKDAPLTESGQVQVFAWTGSDYIQLGGNLDGEGLGDWSGYSVALSMDGSVLAVGAKKNDGLTGIDSGHVRVFEWSGLSWNQRGLDIDGEAAGDESGNSVALSADGDIVAIGATLNDDNGTSSGNTRVFAWTGSMWSQVGSDIVGEAAGDQSGRSVALSADGSFVAAGAHFNHGSGPLSGHVRVYANQRQLI